MPANTLYLHLTSAVNKGTLPANNADISAKAAYVTPGASNGTATTPLLANHTLDTNLGTAQQVQTYTTFAGTVAQQQPLIRFVSMPLAAQTIGGTIGFYGASSASNAASAFSVTWCLGVWRPSTGVLVGMLYDGVNLGQGTATVGSSETTFGMAGITPTAVPMQDGDVLVLEVWRNNNAQTMATSYTNSFFFDGNTIGSSSNCSAYLAFTSYNVVLLSDISVPVPSDPYGSMIYGTTGLLHYWRLNETSGAVAYDSIGNADLTILGNVNKNQPSTAALGNVGMGATAQGATPGDFITLAAPADMLMANGSSFSAEIWRKADGPMSGTSPRIFSCIFQSASYSGWEIDDGEAYVTVLVGNNSTNYWFPSGYAYNSGAADDVNWHHLVLTCDGVNCVLYVDGVARLSGAVPGQFGATGAHNVFICGGYDRADQVANYAGWNGKVDEVAFYNVVLTPAQVVQHYNTGKGGLQGTTATQASSSAALRVNVGGAVTASLSQAASAATLSLTVFSASTGGQASSSAAPALTVPLTLALALSDPMTQKSLNPAWATWGSQGTPFYNAAGYVLSLLSNQSAGVYGGWLTVATYDLTSRYCYQHFQQTPPLQTGIVMTFQLQIDGNNYLEMGVVDTNLVVRYCLAGTLTTLVSIAWPTSTNAQVCIQEYGGTIYFKYTTVYSTPNWLTLATLPNPFAVTALRVNLVGGTYQPVASPNAAVWNWLNWIALTQAFATGATAPASSSGSLIQNAFFTGASVAQAGSSAALTLVTKLTGTLVAQGGVGGSGGAYPAAVLADAPSLYWRLGEIAGSTTVADSSGNGGTGTIGTGVTLGNSGPLVGDANTCAYFPNTDAGHIQGPYLACFNGGPWSVEWWGSHPNNPGQDFPSLVIADAKVGYQYIATLGSGGPKIDFYTETTTSGTPYSSGYGIWHHYVCTFDPASRLGRIYVDGVAVPDGPHTFTQASIVTSGSYTGNGLRVGGIYEGNGQHTSMIGYLDEVAVYPVVLTPARILAHYQAAVTPLAGLQISLVGASTTQAASTNKASLVLGPLPIATQASTSSTPRMLLVGQTITQASVSLLINVKWPLPPQRTTAVLGTPKSILGRMVLGQPTQMPLGFAGVTVAQGSTTGLLFAKQPLPGAGAVTQAASSAALTIKLAAAVVAQASSSLTITGLALQGSGSTQASSTANPRFLLAGATSTQAQADEFPGITLGLVASGSSQVTTSLALGLSLGAQAIAPLTTSVGQLIVSDLVGTSFCGGKTTATLTLVLAPVQITSQGAPTLTPSVPYVGFVLVGSGAASGAPALQPNGPSLDFGALATGGSSTASLPGVGLGLYGFANCIATSSAALTESVVAVAAGRASSSALLSLALVPVVSTAQATTAYALRISLAATAVAGQASASALITQLQIGAVATQATSSAILTVGLTAATVAQATAGGAETVSQPLDAVTVLTHSGTTATILSGYLFTVATVARASSAARLSVALGQVNSLTSATVRAIPLFVQVPPTVIVAQATSSFSGSVIMYELLTGSILAEAQTVSSATLTLNLPPEVEISRGTLSATLTLSLVGATRTQATISGPMHVPLVQATGGRATSSAILSLALLGRVAAGGLLSSTPSLRLEGATVAQTDVRLRTAFVAGLAGSSVARASSTAQTFASAYALRGQASSQAAFSAALGLALVPRVAVAQAASSASPTSLLAGQTTAQAVVRSVVLYAQVSGQTGGRASSTGVLGERFRLVGQPIAQATSTAGLALVFASQQIRAQSSSAASFYLIEPVRLSGQVVAQARYDVAALGLALRGQMVSQASSRTVVFSILLRGATVAQASTVGQAYRYEWLLPLPVVTQAGMAAVFRVLLRASAVGKASSSSVLALRLAAVPVTAHGSTTASLTAWTLFVGHTVAQATLTLVLPFDVQRFEGTKPGGQIIFTRASSTSGGRPLSRTGVGGRGRATTGYPGRVPTENVGPR